MAGGLHRAFERAVRDGCTALQLFTKSSGMWKEPDLSDEAVEAFQRRRATFAGPVLAHTSYLLNLATDKADVLERSKAALVCEIERCTLLGIDYVVLHPGAHLGAGTERAIDQIARALDEVHARCPGSTAQVLLENTAGQGSCVGSRFEELGAIVRRATSGDRLGVCFDTQHAFAAGYDLSTDRGYEQVWEELDRQVGLERVRAFHLNDSKKPLGARVDRHEHVGEGTIGLPLFRRLVNDPRFAETPGVLEIEPRPMPGGVEGYLREVDLLVSLVEPVSPRRRPPALARPRRRGPE